MTAVIVHEASSPAGVLRHVLRGSSGPQGPPGQEGPPGQPIRWTGPWDADGWYGLLDAVEHDGSAWIALGDSHGDEPGPLSESWQLLAAKGDTGPEPDTSLFATRAEVATAKAEAKSEIIGGADAAHDTLMEIAALMAADEGALAALTTTVSGKVGAATLAANTVMYATVDATPAALAVPASSFVGRKAAGDVSAMSVAEAKAVLAYSVADLSNGSSVVINTGTTGRVTTSATGTIVSTDVAANVGLTVNNAHAAPTGDLQRWVKTSTTVASVDKDGLVTGTGFYTGGNVYSQQMKNGSDIGPYISMGTTNVNVINRTTITNVPLAVQGMALQSGNLQEWRNSSSAALASISSAGIVSAAGLGVGAAGVYSAGGFTAANAAAVTTPNIATVALTVTNSNAAPTGKLTSWVRTAAEVASVSEWGRGTFSGGLATTGSGGDLTVSNTASVNTSMAANTPLTLNNSHATPTVPLQIWMRSNLQVSQIDSRGKLIAPAATANTASITLPHGAAPSAPVDGDVWSTAAGLFVRINGVTKTVTLT